MTQTVKIIANTTFQEVASGPSTITINPISGVLDVFVGTGAPGSSSNTFMIKSVAGENFVNIDLGQSDKLFVKATGTNPLNQSTFSFIKTTPGDTGASLKTVTPHASNNLPDGVARALWVGTGGDISIIAESDTVAVVLKNVPSGSTIPIRTKAVRVTGTTATDIVAIY